MRGQVPLVAPQLGQFERNFWQSSVILWFERGRQGEKKLEDEKKKEDEIGKERESWLDRLNKKSWLGVSGWILAVLGFILSIYFYVASIREPNLTYAINPTKAIVVQTGQASQLTTLYKGKPVNSDITAVQIVVWNAGKQAIKHENILKPLIFQMPTGVPILETRIRKSTRDVIGMSLDSSGTTQSQLKVDWRILEQNDAVIIQIVYAGKPEIKISANATIEGQGHLNQIEFQGDPKKTKNELEGRNQVIAKIVVSFMVLWILYYIGIRFVDKSVIENNILPDELRRLRKFFAGLFAMSLAFGCVVGFLAWMIPSFVQSSAMQPPLTF